VRAREQLSALPLAPGVQARLEAMAVQSLRDQKATEARDNLPFELYRQQYVSAQGLGLG
jgi:glutamate--cysteine ligase